MAESRVPGPICQHNKPRDIKGGNSALQNVCGQSQKGDWYLGAMAERTKYVATAWNTATTRFLRASILRNCGPSFFDAVKHVLSSMQVALGAVILSTLLAALCGGAVGSLGGGIGAVPGTIIGAKIGMMTAAWLAGWMGLSVLTRYIQSDAGDIGTLLKEGIVRAWRSGGLQTETDTAAREMAEAIGLFFGLLLRAMVFYLTDSAKRGRTSDAMRALRGSRLFRICVDLEPWLKNNYAMLRMKFVPFNWSVIAYGPPIEGSSVPSWIHLRVGHRQFMINRNSSKTRKVQQSVSGGGTVEVEETIGPATKHMGEDVASRRGSAIPDHHQMASIRTATDFPMSALAGALDFADAKLIFEPRKEHFLDGPEFHGWKLGIDTRNVVWKVYHVTIPRGAGRSRRWRGRVDNNPRPWEKR